MKKIVIIGPESTGKSTLAKLLAEQYKSLWVPEFARDYLLQHGRDYNFEDLLTIAKGQVALEEKYIEESDKIFASHDSFMEDASASEKKQPFLFVDTEMYVMKVWCEFVFGNCHTWIIDQVVKRSYELYLLCDIDLPWIKDELREYPDLLIRQKLYHSYKDIMINQPVPWVNISGSYEQRFEKAIEAIEKHLS